MRLKQIGSASLVVLLFGAAFGVRALNEKRNDFHFAIVGDRTGGAEPQIFGRVWREIDLLHPDFAINVGDSIQGGDDPALETQWREFRSIWQRYQHYPLYFTAGNHDIWSSASRRAYTRETRFETHYSFNYQDAHLTVLDNSETEDLSPQQLEFLEQDLKANKERSPKFVFFHKPYWIALLQGRGADFPLHQIARKYGVAFVISGHGHRFVHMERDGVVYMEVGSSGGTMRGKLLRGEGFAQGCFYHFVWGRVEGSKVYLTVKEIDGAGGRGRMFRAEDWDSRGPKFDAGDPGISWRPET